MGLFTSKKNGCPVCGEPTPKLFPTKVEGKPICKACAKKVFLPDNALAGMSMDRFMDYMNYYEGNQSLRDKFEQTYAYHFGLGSGSIVLDAAHGIFKLTDKKEAIVFEKAHLKGFRILEGKF